MRKVVALFILGTLAVSCASETDATKSSNTARETFEKWVRACVDGDALKVFRGMSDGYKSGWLYDRLGESDSAARRWRGDLTGQARTDLDLWLGVAKKHEDGREEPLPSSVLEHPTLAALFRELFKRDYESGGIPTQMSRLQIAKVYGDDSGVTVAVKNGVGSTELYGMVFERDGWKVDAHRQPLQGR
ncbi:MAG TPA: hypothetical protein VKU80_08550 [Planctomycetota bacterium]|nr:hypothetical protein [Planctomycetota bacterium]